MRDLIRVLVLGTGQMGSGIARLVLEKQGLQLVGVYGRRRERAGMDVGPAIGLDRELGLALGNDLEALLRQTRPDVAIQAGTRMVYTEAAGHATQVGPEAPL